MRRFLSISWCCLFSICGIQGAGADDIQKKDGVEGDYYGVLNNRYQTERFLFRIFRNAEGELDLRVDNLDQDGKYMKDIKMDTLSITSERISFYHKKLHSGFEGKFVTKNRIIIGTWTHNDKPPMHWPCSFARYDDENFVDKTEAGRGPTRGRLSKRATCDVEKDGVGLKLAYDRASSSFVGTVENLTAEVISDINIEVHLSGAIELKLASPVTLEAGKSAEVDISAEGHTFIWWKPLAKVGQ